MVAALNSVECDGVVCRVGCEDCDGGVGWEGVDGSLVGVWIRRRVGWVAGEGDIEVVISLGNVSMQVIADGREFGARDAGHGEGGDLATTAEVEEH